MKKRFVFITGILLVILVYHFWPEKKLRADARIDHIRVLKSKREMIVFYKNEPLATYKISLGAPKPWIFHHPKGPKEFAGDFKTPEGTYKIRRHNGKYSPALWIYYPNSRQIMYAKSKGKDPGTAILIHGQSDKNSFLGKWLRWVDWTEGCIAVTNEEIQEIYAAVTDQCKIEILP